MRKLLYSYTAKHIFYVLRILGEATKYVYFDIRIVIFIYIIFLDRKKKREFYPVSILIIYLNLFRIFNILILL